MEAHSRLCIQAFYEVSDASVTRALRPAAGLTGNEHYGTEYSDRAVVSLQPFTKFKWRIAHSQPWKREPSRARTALGVLAVPRFYLLMQFNAGASRGKQGTAKEKGSKPPDMGARF